MSQGINFRGVLLDQQTISALQSAESAAGFQFTITQGSFNAGGVAASAGTHDGGGAMDLSVSGLSTDQQIAMVKALRDVGFAAWRRSPEEGFIDHVHAILIADPLVSSGAADQIRAYAAGLNGLANGARDTNPIDVAAGHPSSTSPVAGTTPTGGVTPAGFSISPESFAKGFAQTLLSGVWDSLFKPIFKYTVWVGEVLAGVSLMAVGGFMVLQESDKVRDVEKKLGDEASKVAQVVVTKGVGKGVKA